MTNKAQELEVRTIMQGLEEFATFMSYQGSSEGLRIISVESVQQYQAQIQAQKAEVIPIAKHQHSQSNQTVRRSLTFQDRLTH